MRIESVAALNDYLRDFYAACAERAHEGLPYRPPQRTSDAVTQPVTSSSYLGTFRHQGELVFQINNEGDVR